MKLEACALTLMLAASACGAARMTADVPLTLASTAEPTKEIVPSSGKATIVVLYDGSSEPASQAITIVSDRGTGSKREVKGTGSCGIATSRTYVLLREARDGSALDRGSGSRN